MRYSKAQNDLGLVNYVYSDNLSVIGKVFVELIEAGIKSAAKNSDKVIKGASRSSDNVLPALGRATVRGASRSYDSDRERSY